MTAKWFLRTSAIVTMLAGCGLVNKTETASPIEPGSNATIPRVDDETQPDWPEVRKCLFIVLDAAAAKRLSFYGYERETSPAFDGFAERGISFGAAHSVTPSTITSVRTYLTGQYLPKPPPDVPLEYYRIPDGAYTLAEAFADRGYETLGLSQNPHVSETFNFDDGFDTFERLPSRGAVTLANGELVEQSSEALLTKARDWIAERPDDPWFCYLHLLRPHNPFRSPEPYFSKWNTRGYPMVTYGEKTVPEETWWFVKGRDHPLTEEENQYLVDLYDGNIAYVDSLVGEFLAWLQKQGLYDDTLIIIAADHGEAFMEHDRVGHNTTLYQEMLHVPLAFSIPSFWALQPHQVEAPVDLIDLYPTLVELFDLHARDPLHGQSLTKLLRNESTGHKPLLFARTSDLMTFSVRSGTHKAIFERPALDKPWDLTRLFDLSVDPAEKTSQAGTPRGEPFAQQARRALEAFATTHWNEQPIEGGPTLPSELLEELESLGYVADDYR